ncbi:MAG: TIGR00289 family protein [Methanobacteriaceae archaeon]|nr:TIGR00289 family protein [Methanobacteriaceae archaeon]
MKVAALFSGGKDSTMAIYKAIKSGDNVEYLISMISENPHSYMFHVPNIHITDLLSEAMDIPIVNMATKGEKEKELEDLRNILSLLKAAGVEGIYSGALSSTYQKSRIDKICEELGLISYAPLWHLDPKEYMLEIIELGFEVIITSVSAEGFDESFLGRKIDKDLIKVLEKLHGKYHIHLAFEGGEAETLVLDGPLFKKKIKIIKSKTLWEGDSGSLVVEDARLVDKQ